MIRYLRLFQEHSDYEAFRVSEEFVKPNVSECINGDDVHYNPFKWETECFAIESLEDSNSIYLKSPSNSASTVSASTDNGKTWTQYTTNSNENGVLLGTINSNEKIYVKADGLNQQHRFITTNSFNAVGNIMSLINSENFADEKSLPQSFQFCGLFKGQKIVNAENLILPALTLTVSCYDEMFSGCNSLISTPKLPATTLAMQCYDDMFSNCTSLTTAPELPATTLAVSCYQYMFSNCTSLTTAPELPSTTLNSACYKHMFSKCTSLTTAPVLSASILTYNCYQYMFSGCTSLSSITCLATDISASNCTQYWVSGVASSGTFTKAASMNSWTTGVNGIPSGWQTVDAA